MSKEHFFDSLAPDWDAHEVADIHERLERVVDLAQLEPGHRVVDVATGTGPLLQHLAARIGATGSVEAFDIAKGMLEVARGKGIPANVRLFQADVMESGLASGAFDRVVCNSALPHFGDLRGALAEMARWLRPGGLLVISHPIGREAVNRVHARAGEVVEGDLVPDSARMLLLLEGAGLVGCEVIDEPEFYLARGRRP